MNDSCTFAFSFLIGQKKERRSNISGYERGMKLKYSKWTTILEHLFPTEVKSFCAYILTLFLCTLQMSVHNPALGKTAKDRGKSVGEIVNETTIMKEQVQVLIEQHSATER